MEIWLRLAPMSSCRSVAMQVRAAVQQPAISTRYRYDPAPVAAISAATAIRNHQRSRKGDRANNWIPATCRLSWPSNRPPTSNRKAPRQGGVVDARLLDGFAPCGVQPVKAVLVAHRGRRAKIESRMLDLHLIPVKGKIEKAATSLPERARSSPRTLTASRRLPGGGCGAALEGSNSARPLREPNHRCPWRSRKAVFCSLSGRPSATVKWRIRRDSLGARGSIRSTPRAVPA